MRRRVLKAENILSELLHVNDTFYVGVIYDEFINKSKSINYGLGGLSSNQSIIPAKLGSISKQNVLGKYCKKEPEEKIPKKVHISYTRKKDGRKIEYDRIYQVFVKELKHKYNVEFVCKTDSHGQKLIILPLINFSNTDTENMYTNHIINLFLEIFGDFEIYTSDLELALEFTDEYEFKVLPKGTFDENDIKDIVEQASTIIKDPKQVKAFQSRLLLIKDYNPEIIGKGPDGFNGYIVFGFKDLGIVLLESMYLGNATYMFDISNYNQIIKMNKQDILRGKLMKKRFYHHENWVNKMHSLLLNKAAA